MCRSDKYKNLTGIYTGKYNDIAADIANKFPSKDIGIVFPILSRNRFSMILKGIARGVNKITMLLSFPSDEVGNDILDSEKLDDSPFNLGSKITENDYKKYFSDFLHPFTGINMIDFYRDLIEKEDCEVEFVLANDPKVILEYTKDVLTCDIHTRKRTKRILQYQLQIMDSI